MKFKIDENLPAEYALVLRNSGFEADTVGDEALSGADDVAVFNLCLKENRVLVTLDLDFSNVKAYPPGAHNGILVVRCKLQDKLTLIDLLQRAIPVLKERSPAGQLWIIEPDRIRFREG